MSLSIETHITESNTNVCVYVCETKIVGLEILKSIFLTQNKLYEKPELQTWKIKNVTPEADNMSQYETFC